jgi:hypothetical protein
MSARIMWLVSDSDNHQWTSRDIQPTHRRLDVMRDYYEVISYEMGQITFKGGHPYPRVRIYDTALERLGLRVVWILPDGTELEALE